MHISSEYSSHKAKKSPFKKVYLYSLIHKRTISVSLVSDSFFFYVLAFLGHLLLAYLGLKGTLGENVS